jgi:hypothetical protein
MPEWTPVTNVQRIRGERVKSTNLGSVEPFPAVAYENMCSMHDTNHKGNVAEAAIAAAAIKLGVPVMKPLVEHTRYDLILRLGGAYSGFSANGHR